MKKLIFFHHKVTEDFGKDPHPDPLVRGTDPRIRIRTKMSRIRNNGFEVKKVTKKSVTLRCKSV
jgi:hypothetical protein